MILLFVLVQMIFNSSPSDKSLFKPQIIDSTISIGYGIALGDVDGDKKPDILLADKKQFVWYRNGDWKKFVMAENLTAHDNVCIAADDLDGDGRVEVAVGAQWNPGETADKEASGSVHFLIRPADPTSLWKPVKLYHEVTIHRMRWVRSPNRKHYLLVLPLHGQGNKAGEGQAVNLLVYEYPALLKKPDPSYIISTGMHMTHNLDISVTGGKQVIYIAGKEGIGVLDPSFSQASKVTTLLASGNVGTGEIRASKLRSTNIIATVEPMHGNFLAIYSATGSGRRVLDSGLSEGHAAAVADFFSSGNEQVVAGWRRPDKEGKVGIRMYTRKHTQDNLWERSWIDENGMACEDLQVADMNNDGKPDIIAAGRATRNLKIYWNMSAKVK